MFKRAVAVVLFIAMLICLSGCSGLSLKSVDSLMRPPIVSDIDNELKTAFENAVLGKNKTNGAPTGITLLPPSSGDYKSAFILHDIDNDGESEALVFYSKQEDPSKGHMNILDYEKGEWISVADFSAAGSSINFVRFVQMTSDGCPSILVSQSIYEGDSSKVLSVYVCDTSSEELTVKNICTEVCTVMENVDVDSDGQLDIFIIQQDFSNNTSPQSVAKVLKMNDTGVIAEFGAAKLDGGISSYLSVKTEKAGASSPMRIYVDALKGEIQTITEVIYWNAVSKSLVTPMFNVETQSNIVTRRDEKLASQDFDGDGVIEIPSQMVFEGARRYASAKNIYEQMNITEWIEIKTDTDFERTRTLVNSMDSYLVYFNALEKIMGGFTVYAYDNSRTWVFKVYNSAIQYVGEDLFAIVGATKEEAEKRNISKANYLIENDSTVVYFEPKAKGTEAGITADSIKPYIKSFKG
ncbi:MAG: hypothetical protein IJN85_00060 [Oscillospiraceae bacterium]|nr:hypothetical protein [Oscillospiraceae bacterium]